MFAQVKFEPQEPRTKGDTTYIDIVATLDDGEEIKCYAQEETADWNALKRLERGEIVEVETYEKNGQTHYRLTEFQLDLTLSGQQHIANVGDTADPFEVLSILTDLYASANRSLAEEDLPIDPTGQNAQKLAVTAYMQVYN